VRRISIHLAAFLLALIGTAAVAGTKEGFESYGAANYAAAYRQLLPFATDDNPEIQNFVGFMLYYGQGIEPDRRRAHDLFHRAATNGSRDAYVNLGVVHSIGAEGVPVDYREALEAFAKAAVMDDVASVAGEGATARVPIPDQFETLVRVEAEGNAKGREVFLRFCAGCHGFNGFALFPLAPSFAMGERLAQSDAVLMYSIVNGKNLMPSWGDKLEHELLRQALVYLRVLAIRSGFGQLPAAGNTPPEQFYIFDPPGSAPGSNDWYLRR